MEGTPKVVVYPTFEVQSILDDSVLFSFYVLTIFLIFEQFE